MKKTISIEILERYIANECTPAEKALVKDWYQSLEKEYDYVSDLNESEEQWLEEKIYNQILNDIQNTEEIEIVTPNKYRYLKIGYAAAAIAAMFLIYIAVVFKQKQAVNNPVADLNSLQMFVVKNTTKQIYKTMLPDGSTAWLSPDAEIRYPQNFDSKFRMVSLSGESFFEVTKNPQRPFIINSRSIVTKVWGTSFRVRDDVSGNRAEVTVVTGKVSVSIRNSNMQASTKIEKNEVLLYPNQKVTFLSEQHALKTGKETDKASLQIWNRVNLSFDNTTLKNIVPILNSKFNAHLVITNEKLNHYVLDADFTEFNLPDVLQALKKTLGVNYELKNNAIELK
jgi:ferric-dicitrate binding protein FerR (iron transport regulator)